MNTATYLFPRLRDGTPNVKSIALTQQLQEQSI